ncbi:MAG: hypothetical protein CM15mP66_00120 [Pseudomonadota bacterium]|nr:MAG: hypothetical protein CM15mP66_00120 [Pseudomonadota bacterium]
MGNAEFLRNLGIEVIHDLKGVGEGFQDHYAIRVANRVKGLQTLNERGRGISLIWEILKWFATGKGLLAFSPASVGAFIRSTPELSRPDLQGFPSSRSKSYSEARVLLEN